MAGEKPRRRDRGAGHGSGGRPARGGSDPPRALTADGRVYMLRCARGLAPLLIQELRFRAVVDSRARPRILRQRGHDLVLAEGCRIAPPTVDLRLAEESGRCVTQGRFKISKRQLDAVAGVLAGGRPRTLQVNVSGRQFERRTLGRWIEKEMAARGVTLVASGPDVAWLFCVDERFYFCLRERSAETAAGRERRVAERAGSLPPTIAGALVFVGRPQAGEALLDPMCGSGTILAEADGLRPGLTLIGMDSDRSAVAVARRNLEGTAGLRLSEGDARATGLPDGSVDLVVANLPFGKQFGDRSENAGLYAEAIREWRRVGRPGRWRAVVLTGDLVALAAALEACPGLAARRIAAVEVRGEAAEIWHLSER